MEYKHQLVVAQLDRKLQQFREAKKEGLPPKGWIYTVRKALNMTQEQLADRMGISKQYVSRMENNEMDGGITLQSMKEVAHALDMQLVYAIVPTEESMNEKLKKQAKNLACEIVRRTSHSMALEGQEIGPEQLEYAIEQKTEQLMEEMPKYLWD